MTPKVGVSGKTSQEAFSKLRVGTTVISEGDTGYFDVVVDDDEYYVVPNGDQNMRHQLFWDSTQEVYYFRPLRLARQR